MTDAIPSPKGGDALASLRWPEFDNLRALAMLLGVLFHAALAYSPLMQPYFPTADRQSAAVVDWLIWFPHLFRMPLFFVIAGFFSAMLIERRGMVGMLASRAKRIGLVFLMCWPLVALAMTGLMGWAIVHVEHPSAVLRYLRTQDAVTPMPLSTVHLWFLYYLLIFHVIVWALNALVPRWPRFEWLKRMSPAALLLLCPLLLFPALLSVPAPHPAPESFLPMFWAIGFYGPFFAAGFWMHRHPEVLDTWKSWATRLLLASLGMYVVFMLLLGGLGKSLPADSAWKYATVPYRFPLHWMLAVCGAAISVWMSVACLIFARRALRRLSPWLAPLAAASYWTYIWHLPVLFAMQYVLMDVQWWWPIKLLTSVTVTIGICLTSLALLRRLLAVRLGITRG